MKKFFLLSSLVLLSLNSYAANPLSAQELHIMVKNKSIGRFKLGAIVPQGDSLTMQSDSSGATKLPNGINLKFKTSSKHILSKDWVWQSSDLVAPGPKPVPISITVSPTQVSYKTVAFKKPVFKSLNYKGSIMPRRVFYNYLRDLKAPPSMEVHQINIFNEIDLTIHQATWVYLGPQNLGKVPVRSYELKGDKGLSSIILIDDKTSEILKVKELDLGLELVK
jgi:hypothetical protein